MIRRRDWQMIEARYRQGVYQKDIAAELGVSERTVRRALGRSGPPPGKRPGSRGSKLDPFKDQVDALLSDNVWNAVVIYRALQAAGYTGSINLLRDYIAPKRPIREAKATVRFETIPGFQLQHDWTDVVVILAGMPTTVKVAGNLLGYSRRFHAWAAPRADAEHTYESLIRAFEHFGGVPAEVLVDNQRSAVLAHPSPDEVRFNERFRDLAGRYGFQPRACRPYRARTKGKVERAIGYMKHNFFVQYQAFDGLAHLNQALEHWLAEEANPRKHGTVREPVRERFDRDEAAQLGPLPRDRFDTSYREQRQVGWDGYIDVRGNRYSVPADYCGQTVGVRIGLDDSLRILDRDGRLIGRHRLRSPDEGWATVAEHHAPLWAQVAVEKRDLAVYEEAQ